MNYRMFYTLHAFCGFFVMLQLIFHQSWLPFHLLATLLSLHLIYRFHRCRWAHFECCLALVVLYFFRVLLLYFLTAWAFCWYIYYLLLFMIGIGFLLIALRLFFC